MERRTKLTPVRMPLLASDDLATRMEYEKQTFAKYISESGRCKTSFDKNR